MAVYQLGTATGTIQLDYNGNGVADRATRDMDTVAASGDKSKAALDKTSKGMLIAGAGLVGGLALAVKSAADFEKSLSGIKAVSGGTGEQMAAVSKKALQLGADTQFSAGEAATAIEELVKAGISLPDVLNGAADATVALAAAGSVDLPVAATIAANSMNQFGLTAKQMPAIVDQIAGAANASAIDVTDFGNSLTQVGAVANLAGLSFKDTAVAIAEMGNAGIKGSDAGTSLKTMLQNLIPTTKAQINESIKLGLITAGNHTAMEKLAQRGIKPLSNSYADVSKAMMDYVVKQTGLKAGSNDAQKAVSELGVSTGAIQNQFFDATGKVKKLSDIQAVLQKAYKGSTREQMLQSQGMLFGTDAIRASAVLTKAGAAGYDKMSTAMGKMSAADVAKTRMNNLAGSVEQLKGSAETMAIGLGSVLLPMLKAVADQLTSLVNWFVSLSPGMQKALVIAIGFAGGLLLLVGGLIKAVQFAKALKATMILLNGTFLANPIFLIIVAIIALIAIFVALYKNNAAFRAFIDKMWKGIQAVIGAVVGWIVNTAVPWIVNAWNAIVNGAKALWAAIVSVWNAISTAISTVFNFILMLITTYVNMWKTIITTAINFILGIWRAVWGLFGPLIMGVFNLIVAIIQLAMRIIKLVITTAWNFIYAVVSGAVNRIRAIVTAVFGAINGFILRVFNGIKSFVTTIWNAIYGAVSGPVGRVLSVVSSAFNTVKGVVSTVFNAIKGIATTAWNAVTTAISTALDAAKTKVSDAINTIKGFFSGAGTWLLDAGKKLIQGLIDGIKAMVKKVTDAISSITDKIKGFLPGSPIKEGPLVEWNNGTPGKKLVKMLASGIADNVGMLDGAFAGVDLGLPTVLTGPVIAVAGSASRTGASGVNSGATGADRPSVYAPVTVNAPQTMSPEQVGRATATRLGYALSGHTTPIPVPAGAR